MGYCGRGQYCARYFHVTDSLSKNGTMISNNVINDFNLKLWLVGNVFIFKMWRKDLSSLNFLKMNQPRCCENGGSRTGKIGQRSFPRWALSCL